MEHETDLIDWSAYDPDKMTMREAALHWLARILLLVAFTAAIWALAGCSSVPKERASNWSYTECYNSPPYFSRPTSCPPRSAFVTETDRQIRAGVARVQH